MRHRIATTALLLALAAPLSAQLETDAFTAVSVDLSDRGVVPFGVGGEAGYAAGSIIIGASASWSPISGHATRATLEFGAGGASRFLAFIGDTRTAAPEGEEPDTDEPEDYGVSVGDFNTVGFGFRASNDSGGFIEARLNRVRPMDETRWSLEFRLSP